MKKKCFALTLITVLVISAFAFTGCGKSDGGSEGEVIELNMSVTPSEQSVWMVAATTFKEEVEKNTNGRYKINIYPNEQLSSGDMPKGIEQIISGQTDLDIHSVMLYGTVDERFTILTMPWLFANGYEDVDKYLFNGEGGVKIKELLDENGVHCMALGENGFRQLTNNVRPVNTPDDMKGLKIRIPANNMYIALFKALGADPVAMNWGEVFTAIQQGTIDGQENPMDTIRSAKIGEIQEYLTVWNYSYDPIALCASKKLWDSLSDEDKEIFEAAAIKGCEEEVKQTRIIEKELIESSKETMEVNELTEEQIAEFKALVAPIYEQYRDVIGDDLFKAFGYEFN